MANESPRERDVPIGSDAAVNRTRPLPAWAERALALSLAFFFVAQAALLDWAGALPAQFRIEIWVVTIALSGLAAQAWLVRRMLPAHTDMLLLMMAWGGFGMLLGWMLDGGLQAMQANAAHHAMAHHAMADHAMAGHATTPVYSGVFRWVNGMNALMLLFAFPPSVQWARCLAAYRPFPLRLAWVLLMDAAGMIFGMMAGGRLLGHPLAMILDAPAFAHFIAMLIGMLAGMALTMLARPWLAPLRRL